MRRNLLKDALQRFLQHSGQIPAMTLFDFTVLRFGEALREAVQSYPQLGWHIPADVEVELAVYAKNPESSQGTLAAWLLAQVPVWPGNLTDFYQKGPACETILFVMGGLMQYIEFVQLCQGDPWLLTRTSWSLEKQLPFQCQVLRRSAAVPYITNPRAVLAERRAIQRQEEEQLTICGADGTRAVLQPARQLGPVLYRGGEGRIQPLLGTKSLAKTYYEAMGDCSGDMRANLLLRLKTEGVAFPTAILRSGHGIAGYLMDRYPSERLDQLAPGTRLPAVEALASRLLELRLQDVLVVDLTPSNTGYWAKKGRAGGVVYDVDGFQVRSSPALALHDGLAHPAVKPNQLVFPSWQAYAEGAFFLYSLLHGPTGDDCPFYRDSRGRRRFRCSAWDAGWPDGMPQAERLAWIDALESKSPPACSLGQWIAQLRRFF